jgi:hypothetical protein
MRRPECLSWPCETLAREVPTDARRRIDDGNRPRRCTPGVRFLWHRRQGSPYAFVGTVISTETKDHVATVITDNGQRVTVLGTEGGFPESFRSTDRRYALSGRYEFDPLNAESPYRDNEATVC